MPTNEPEGIVERTVENKCKKVQFIKPYISREMIEAAHANGIRCNIFWSDDISETKEFIEMGIETILTNGYNRIASAIKSR